MRGWPWQRFEAFFESFAKRQLVESLDKRKLAIVTGLHANMNMSGEDLRKAIEGIEESFEEAVASIYGKLEDDIDKSNPFFGKIKLPEVDQASKSDIETVTTD